jgi:hypothetical protein
LKRNDKIGSKIKRDEKYFGSETKRKYGVLISLWIEAKNLKRKIRSEKFEAKKSKQNFFFA